jgi:serine protease AprX
MAILHMKKIFTALCLTLIAYTTQAQMTSHYWVFFKDKNCAQSPAADFDPKALARRAQMGIDFPQFDDFPVNEADVAMVAAKVQAQRHVLRWWNAMTVTATPQQMAVVEVLPFVLRVEPMAMMQMQLATLPQAVTENEAMELEDNLAAAKDSTKLHKLFESQRSLVQMQLLEDAGLSGKGVRIAILDAGFDGADKHVAFTHLHQNHQIKGTKDFVGHDDKVYAHSNHGTAVLSCIGGMYEGRRIGAATEAEFLLARTERNLREPISEEDNWLAAMEWADQNGADILSSSLGYTKPRYTYADMTGSKSRVSHAAAIAVRKGMLVVISAGNEGRGKFHFIGTPADTDSVLTVGGSYPMMAYRMPFSSFGPNARGIMKPEIAGPGYVLAANKSGDYRPIGGTSFACPIVAGMAACIMQKWPAESNVQIKQRIMTAGNTYPYFDYELGFGVLQASRILAPIDGEAVPTFNVERKRDTLWVQIDPQALALDSAIYKNGKPFSIHYILPDGKLSSSKTYLLRQNNFRFGLPPADPAKGRVEMWFQGYMWRGK